MAPILFGICPEKLLLAKSRYNRFFIWPKDGGMLPEKLFPGKIHSIMAGKYDPNSLGSVPLSPERERCMYCKDDRFIKFLKPPCKYLTVSKSKNQSFFNFAILFGITPRNVFPPRLRTCNSVKFPMSCGISP